MGISENIKSIKATIPPSVTLVAVSKTRSVDEIMETYNAGQRIFGENKIQEMEAKWKELPQDIEWHMIGHVQTNKVKYIAPFVRLIHATHSLKLLKEINKQAEKHERVIHCLLQIKIAKEESKYGMSEQDASNLLASEEFKSLQNVKITGLMGMATFTDDKKLIHKEFEKLKKCFEDLKVTHNFSVLSMGMSGDYMLAIESGSTMIRVGSSIFGERSYA